MAGTTADSLLVTHLPNVRYLTGFTGSSGCALITPRQKIFFTDSRYTLQATREVKGFKVVAGSGAPFITACRHISGRSLKTGVLGYEASHVSCSTLKAVKKELRGFRLVDASGTIEQRRQVKQPRELLGIRKACAMADAALAHLRRARVIGRREDEVAWMLESYMRQHGSGPLPFEIIVASGPRSAMPHGSPTARVIRQNELVVIDMGATVNGYCSDITRTFATGRLTPRQLEIYDVVLEAQDRAVRAIKPGAACAAIDGVAREHISASGFGAAFGHALGHGIGLEAHEQPVLSHRSREKLEEGMTVTVEPGVYVTRTGGVRIEDTVLVTATGVSRLTRFPRELIRLK
jgi:Xaa-Pro aminopeptidase